MKPAARKRAHPCGKVNFIGVVMLAGITYGIWWVVTYSTIHLDNLDVKTAVDAAFNQSPRESNATLVSTLTRALNFNNVGWHWEELDTGERVKKPGLGVLDEAITIERDDVSSTILVRVEYEREVELKPFEKVESVKFVVEKKGKIPPP